MEKIDKIRVNHMYANSLNIYGDLGNIIALRHLCNLKNIEIEILNTEIGDRPQEADIYFIGGGQDKDQIEVYRDLLKKKEFIKKEVESSKVFLLICGGFQLFGHHFLDGDNNLIEGLGILDVETKAPDASVKSRCIGNLIAELTDEFINHFEIETEFSKFIVGFENHGGQTKITSAETKIVANVKSGFGNNSFEKVEGSWKRNIIASYCHGSLLPKNPHLGLAIIRKALKNKGNSMQIEFKLNDFDVEKKAHLEILKRII